MNKLIVLVFLLLQIVNVFGMCISQKKCEDYQKLIATNIRNVTSKEFPFMAKIVINGGYYIGILISENFVLTAITIAFNSAAKKQVFLGDSQFESDSQPQTFKVIEEICHPEFNFPINNIKLLKLNASVKFNDYNQPETVISERLIEIASVGRLSRKSESSLHKVKCNLILNCKAATTELSFRKYFQGFESGLNFCANAKKGDRGFCDTYGGTALLNDQIGESNLNEIVGMNRSILDVGMMD